MTRKEAEQQAEVMLAWARGEEIQSKCVGSEHWRPIPVSLYDIHFLWNYRDYRVKPKPLEFWVNVYSESDISSGYETKQMADACAGRERLRCIKVREVEDA